jgi:hypothetical protein
MANLKDNSRVYGSLTVDKALIAGAGGGFQNRVVFTSGSSVTYTFPAALQVPGANFKVTLIGGGGSGGGCAAAAGRSGGGGGSGAVVIAYYKVLAFSFIYTVGAGGGGVTNAVGNNGFDTFITYAGGACVAGGGAGGGVAESVTTAAGGTATLPTNSINTISFAGNPGGTSGVRATSGPVNGEGGSTPLGFGQGGINGKWDGAGTDPKIGTGYGAGGGGAFSITASTGAGSAGAPGVLILEY